MNAFLAFAITFATFCVCTAIVLASIRLFRGPFAQDRILAYDTIYINGMLVLLIQAIRTGSPVFFDIALLIALFGFVGTLALARFLLRREVIEP